MYTEIKYLNLLSPRLEKFSHKKDYLWNFRCPICGDSKKHRNKARGFVFRVKSDLMFKCHNCQASLPLPKLIEKLDPQLYKEYRLEKFKDSNKSTPKKSVVERVVRQKPVFRKNILSSLTPIEQLNKSHPAREYLLNRRLPLSSLYYTDSFMEFTNSVKPGTFDNITKDEGRIIIPLTDKEGFTFGYQGRSLSSTGIRYITILLNEDAQKIFGLNTVNYEKPVYITEGPLDSLLLQNSVAMAGADADSGSFGWSDYIWVFDNEPRNREITARISKLIDRGDKVVIWPSSIVEKDINDMHLAGHPVQDIVARNTYSGLTAKLKFNTWRK
jgi:hypothetical protein